MPEPGLRSLKSAIPFALGTLLLWCWVTSLYLPVMKSQPGTDAGVFSAVALELIHGSSLYSEVFESKLPGIFLWNAFALDTLKLGFISIRYMEWIFILLLAPLLLRMTRFFGLSLFSSLVLIGWTFFLWLQPFVFGSGNQTETMSVGLIMAGTALALSTQRTVWILFSAFLLGASIWFREQVAVAAAVYFLWILWEQPSKNRWLILIAAALPSLGMLWWMAWSGSLDAWWTHYPHYLKQYYAYARMETAHFSTWDRWTGILWNQFLHRQWGVLLWTLLSLIAAWHPLVRKRSRNFSLVSFFLLLFHLWLTLRSGYMFGHYFQLILFEWLILQLWIPVWLSQIRLPDTFRLPFKSFEIAGSALFLLMLIPVFIPRATEYKLLLPRHYATDQFTRYIQEHIKKTERLYVDAPAFGQYYADTGVPSGLSFPVPVFHYYTLRVFGNYPERNAEKQMEKLKSMPPAYIILDKDYSLMFYRGQGTAWFELNYQEVPLRSEYSEDLRLFERKF